MIKNYLTIAVRNIARNKTFSAINILGLAIGMACCILILLYVQTVMPSLKMVFCSPMRMFLKSSIFHSAKEIQRRHFWNLFLL